MIWVGNFRSLRSALQVPLRLLQAGVVCEGANYAFGRANVACPR